MHLYASHQVMNIYAAIVLCVSIMCAWTHHSDFVAHGGESSKDCKVDLIKSLDNMRGTGTWVSMYKESAWTTSSRY